MSTECALGCGQPLNPFDIGVWKEVRGFVGGQKKDSMVLREDTGRHAHASCVEKARAGFSPSQPELLEEAKPNGSIGCFPPALNSEDSDDVAELEDFA